MNGFYFDYAGFMMEGSRFWFYADFIMDENAMDVMLSLC